MRNRSLSSASWLLAAVLSTFLLHSLGGVAGVHAAPHASECPSKSAVTPPGAVPTTDTDSTYVPTTTPEAAPPKETPTPEGTNTTTPSNNGGYSNGTTGDVLKMGYWASWDKNSDFPWDKYNYVAYAFVLVNGTADCLGLNTDDQVKLPEFVKNAKAHNVKALISVGGWTGSTKFSPAVATADNRKLFIEALLGLVKRYEADGIDFDWEHPNNPGIGCNDKSPDDTANYLTFLQEIRKEPGAEGLYFSAAVRVEPFYGSENGPDGSPAPVSDVSGFAKVLDHINIMAYDINGPWGDGVVGPNAPLTMDGCGPSSVLPYSAASAVKSWTAAGFPKEQIVMGVGAYGHSFGVPSADYKLYSAQATLNYNPKLPADPGEKDVCGVVQNGTDVYPFSQLVADGYLNADGTATSNVKYQYDECTQTPFIYVANGGSSGPAVISYDDPKSFKAKGDFISCQGLKGYAVWDVNGDPQGVLLDAINEGFEQGSCS